VVLDIERFAGHAQRLIAVIEGVANRRSGWLGLAGGFDG